MVEKKFLDYIATLSDEQMQNLNQYLLERCDNNGKKKKFSIVFDLLHQCDIACRGCGTNARMVTCQSISDNTLKFNEVVYILDKIKSFVEKKELEVFINFGGGEPFLRDDIIDILQYAAHVFGAESIGIDTNASLDSSFEKISAAMDYVSYVGVSINGLRDYHNWWANNDRIDAFSKATDTVKKLCVVPEFAEKVEVTTVVTKQNMDTITELMVYLKGIHVKRYSLHRPIPVGRMKRYFKTLIPSASDYFKLLVELVEQSRKLNMHAHIHHSIEGIYGFWMAGIDTFYDDNILSANYRSSIGIEPNGDVVVDPWCTVDFWKQLKLGNILERNTEIENLFDTSSELLQRLRECISKNNRCNGCEKNCSGGSRLVAAASHLSNVDTNKIDLNMILKAMTAVDPACPLADRRKDESF